MIKKNRCERRQIMVDSLVNVDDELIESIWAWIVLLPHMVGFEYTYGTDSVHRDSDSNILWIELH